MTVAQLAGELADEQRRLDLLDAGGDPGSAIRGIFSWSYGHLPDEEARAFRLLGLSPGLDIDACAAAALTGTVPAQASLMLELLARTHLIHRTRTGRYGLHDVLRAYAAGLAAAGDHRRALKVSQQIGDRSGEVTALNNLGIIYERQGRHQPAADHYRQTAILSAELDDQSGEGRAPAILGGIDCLQSRYEQAARHPHRALVLFRKIGDRQGEAAALAGLGLVDGLQGRYERAAENYRQVIWLAVQIGDG
jgi:tetratricopeptide (TPR) repeat protein